MQKQKGISTLSVIIIIIVIAIIVIGGVLVYQSFSTKTQPVAQTQQIQNTTTQTQNQQQTANQQTNNVQPTDQTAGWKTYTNTQYGFEIKYNPIYVVESSDVSGQLGISIQNYVKPGVPTILSSWYNITAKQNISSLNALEKFYPDLGLVKPNTLTLTNTTISGQEAVDIKYISPVAYDHYVHAIGVVKNNTAYIISYWNDKEDSAKEKEFEQMLSTFKFTK